VTIDAVVARERDLIIGSRCDGKKFRPVRVNGAAWLQSNSRSAHGPHSQGGRARVIKLPVLSEGRPRAMGRHSQGGRLPPSRLDTAGDRDPLPTPGEGALIGQGDRRHGSPSRAEGGRL
jgi:hypothetical protein